MLGVADSASQVEIQQAYRRLAKACHPDRNPEREEWAKDAFQAVSEAYSVLGSTDTRQSYDRLRWPHTRHAGGARKQARGPAFADWAAQARAAYTTEGGQYEPPAYTSADWSRQPPPPPPGPEFSAGSPLVSLRSLLRGPYGSLYVVVLVVVLFMPVSYMAVMRFSGHALDSVLSAAADVPAPACVAGAVMIDAPVGGSVPAHFEVSGTASDPELAAYAVEWAYLGYTDAADLTTVTWTQADTPGDTSVNAAPLADVRLPDLDGVFALRLIVVQEDGTVLPPCVVYVAHGSS